MNYPAKRRLEIWIHFGICALLAGLFVGLAMRESQQSHHAFWMLAGAFIVPLPLLAWKATRPDQIFKREKEGFETFIKRHRAFYVFILACGTFTALWNIAAVLGNIAKYFKK